MQTGNLAADPPQEAVLRHSYPLHCLSPFPRLLCTLILVCAFLPRYSHLAHTAGQ